MRALLAITLAFLVAELRAEEPITLADREHWAFIPPSRPQVPPGVAHPIDHFIQRDLATQGLGFSPEADPRTLLRRLSFGLTGLPPTPEETRAFLTDDSPDAYGKVVDRLLASPAYGERWAQHWLDVARFAESDGFEHDKVREGAWRYRDWVIAALNDDLRYDRFVQMQLAADEIAPDDEGAQAATGFLLAGPDMPDINRMEERRHNFLNGMTAAVGEAFMSLTLGCAQCHDHRTDPVSIDDFYRLQAVFANTIDPEKNKPLGERVKEKSPTPPASFVMTRGAFDRPGAEVEPAFLRILNPGGAAIRRAPEGASSSMRRAAFARWLTRPEHPLTSRVIVNRLWQHHFGKGIVPSSGDFGRTGVAPSHPELLDWLATELPRRGWSLKAMQRLIVTSQTYRQASRGDGSAWEDALRLDPDNVLFSRMPRRRLDGESIRDSFLAVSGRLNPVGGGPSVRPPLPDEVTTTLLSNQWEVTADEAGHRRRSIYIFARRNLRYPMFDVFDRPDSNRSCSRRGTSTTAPQSLMLLNSEFSLATAKALAERVADEGTAVEGRITLAYELLFARPPSGKELALGQGFLTEGGGLAAYFLALLNTNEAIYLD